MIALTKPDFTSYLSSLGNISSTVIPELTKYTEDNRVNFYPKPIDVCVGKFGTLLILFDFCEKEQTSSLLSARLHGPVDNIKIVKKALKAGEVICKDRVAFLCGRSAPITVVEIESGTLEISESKIKIKSALILVLQRLQLNTNGTFSILKKELQSYLKELSST